MPGCCNVNRMPVESRRVSSIHSLLTTPPMECGPTLSGMGQHQAAHIPYNHHSRVVPPMVPVMMAVPPQAPVPVPAPLPHRVYVMSPPLNYHPYQTTTQGIPQPLNQPYALYQHHAPLPGGNNFFTTVGCATPGGGRNEIYYGGLISPERTPVGGLPPPPPLPRRCSTVTPTPMAMTAVTPVQALGIASRRGRYRLWTREEDELLREYKGRQLLSWRAIGEKFPLRTLHACQFRWRKINSMGPSSGKN